MALENFDFPRVRHYYGDAVRGCFLAAAALMLLGAPLYSSGDELLANIPFIVVGIVVIVALAALTNPYKRWVITLDAVAAGAGAALYGLWALTEYQNAGPLEFVLRGFIALLLLFAFYFSMKTLRAMMLHQIGHGDSAQDFKKHEQYHDRYEYDDDDDDDDEVDEEGLTKEQINWRAHQERVNEDS